MRLKLTDALINCKKTDAHLRLSPVSLRFNQCTLNLDFSKIDYSKKNNNFVTLLLFFYYINIYIVVKNFANNLTMQNCIIFYKDVLIN